MAALRNNLTGDKLLETVTLFVSDDDYRHREHEDWPYRTIDNYIRYLLIPSLIKRRCQRRFMRFIRLTVNHMENKVMYRNFGAKELGPLLIFNILCILESTSFMNK